jgi:probable phosphomutase (TIGR03848 family)
VGIVLLIRHAVTDQTGKKLYGRTEGISISERGREQAEGLVERLEGVPIAALYLSPMERCVQTAAPLVRARGLEPETLPGLNEIDYGEWAGRSFATLSRSNAWKRVRHAPASVRFPGGETLWEAQRRAVEAIEEVAARHRRKIAAVVTHGDVVRLALAHYAGIHIDLFQRLEVATASVSAIALGDSGPRILKVNDTGDLRDVVPPRPARTGSRGRKVQG